MLKVIASAINLISSIWGIMLAAASLSLLSLPLGAINGNLASWLLMGLGVVLLLDSIVCFLGLRLAFYVATILSVLQMILLAAAGNPTSNVNSLIGIAISVAAIVSDMLAARSGAGIPEQIHPLNLPVFG